MIGLTVFCQVAAHCSFLARKSRRIEEELHSSGAITDWLCRLVTEPDYAFSQIHNIQYGVPPENILAMADAALDYGSWTCSITPFRGV
jgi:hypothetical protein